MGKRGEKREEAKLYWAFTKLSGSFLNNPHHYLFSPLCNTEGKVLCLIRGPAEWLQAYSWLEEGDRWEKSVEKVEMVRNKQLTSRLRGREVQIQPLPLLGALVQGCHTHSDTFSNCHWDAKYIRGGPGWRSWTSILQTHLKSYRLWALHGRGHSLRPEGACHLNSEEATKAKTLIKTEFSSVTIYPQNGTRFKIWSGRNDCAWLLASLLIASKMADQGDHSSLRPLPAVQRVHLGKRIQLPGGSALPAKTPELSQPPTALPQHLHSAMHIVGTPSSSPLLWAIVHHDTEKRTEKQSFQRAPHCLI